MELTFELFVVQNENFEKVLNPNFTRKPCKMELKPMSDAMGQVLIQCGVQESTLSVYNEECGSWNARKHTWLTGVCEYIFKKSYRLVLMTLYLLNFVHRRLYSKSSRRYMLRSRFISFGDIKEASGSCYSVTMYPRNRLWYV